jgi:hypothetical protein
LAVWPHHTTGAPAPQPAPFSPIFGRSLSTDVVTTVT